MVAAINTVTKTASVVKTTKGSEKKWSEILSMNRRHDLQLPNDIAKYDVQSKRSNNLYQRQKDHQERLWAHKHETWYQDDFLFRNRLLTQLKPITRRFKHIHSVLSDDNDDRRRMELLNDDSTDNISSQKEFSLTPNRDLPPVKNINKRSKIGRFHSFSNEDNSQTNAISKLTCSKVLHDYEPRLHSNRHAPFLDVAQRFLVRKPELIEKGIDNAERQRQQKQRLRNFIETERERTRLAAVRFGQQMQEEKNREKNRDEVYEDEYFINDENDSSYTKPF